MDDNVPAEARGMVEAVDAILADMGLAPQGNARSQLAAMSATISPRGERPDHTKWQHVAYYDEGQFQWMSGIAPRNCELYAPVAAPADNAGLVEALTECRRVLYSRIPRLGPEGPDTAEQQTEYEEVGGAWLMADRALRANGAEQAKEPSQ